MPCTGNSGGTDQTERKKMQLVEMQPKVVVDDIAVDIVGGGLLWQVDRPIVLSKI